MRPSKRVSTLGAASTEVAARRKGNTESLTRTIRGDLDWIVMKALEKDRARRYETANGFAADIGRFLADEPVLAAAPSARYKLQKAWRRNKTIMTAAVLVFLSLVIGLTVSLIKTSEAWEARKSEERQRRGLLT